MSIQTLRSDYTANIQQQEQNIADARKYIQECTAQILLLRGGLSTLDALEAETSEQKESPDGNPTPDLMVK